MFQSIFQGIINSLPPDPSGVVITTLVAVGIGLGALTALLGALHSRPTMSMMMFACGTVVGYALPAWMGWDINRSISIAAGGVIFGVAGYVLHKWCVAVSLGALVAAVAMVLFYDQSTITVDPQSAPAVQLDAGVQKLVQAHWQASPPRFRSLAPWLAAGSFVAAAIVALALPKFGMAALYALGGTLLTLFSIGLGHTSDRIHWLDSLKDGPMTVAALGITMLLVGFLAQVGLVYRPQPRQPDEAETSKRQPATE